jgi:hypothetical protein
VSSDLDRDRLSALMSVLESARRLVDDLENPLLVRLVDVFMRMPEGDRDVLIGAIEREVRTRLVSPRSPNAHAGRATTQSERPSLPARLRAPERR